MDHDVGHGELAQIEHAAHHVAVELLHDAGAMHEVDGAAQLLARRKDGVDLADLHADPAQNDPHQPLDRLQDRQRSSETVRSIGWATASAMRSGALNAAVFGSTSHSTKISAVITMVA